MSLWIFVLLVGAMNYEAVLVMPEMSDSKPPLVVFPHGNI
jgi:poly(3-hydroxybutyrate) depolymerase